MSRKALNVKRLSRKRRVELLLAKVEYQKLDYLISNVYFWQTSESEEGKGRLKRYRQEQADLVEKFGTVVEGRKT